MSTSFGFTTTPTSAVAGSGAVTSPVASFSASNAAGNPFHNPIISPSSSSIPSSSGATTGVNTATSSSTLASLSSSIPSSLNRRFSANFTNPLTSSTLATSPTTQDERGRRQSLFGSSPPLSRHLTDIHEPTFNITTHNTATHAYDSTDGGGGGGGGIGGLFRKFSVSGRSSHPLTDRNEPGPASSHEMPNTHQGPPLNLSGMAHIKAVDALKPPASQKEHISRSSSPMRSMILNGQMLD
ncbi:hypothetical protein BGZ95_000940 [Linnemannia exigua]|uniref:Uncharacterized protein n=1 Tax=Linnemannia exigua TaxID=604196 RepID=A0AAD4D7V5_9FUNG|nr:hypothetical protein BGZ95_000940 [Linnemannia exigua]